ncbi:hypothetical protein EDC04DRAFT_2889547 [Pisolithus marmoratus]|nr:hypothetical protein EDC04DRAFT_2889547 [Pisolithus marmoratus]
MPKSLSHSYGLCVASKCHQLLRKHNIINIDVEIQGLVITHSAGPKLLNHTNSLNPTITVCEPLTATLGLPICPQSVPWAEGTGSFFITEGGDTKKLFLITACHIIFPLEKFDNMHYKYKNNSQCCHNIMVLGDALFRRCLKSIQTKVTNQAIIAQHLEAHIRQPVHDLAVNLEEDAMTLVEARRAMEQLNILYRDVSTHWATSESHVIGHVILSLPIGLNVGMRAILKTGQLSRLMPQRSM